METEQEIMRGIVAVSTLQNMVRQDNKTQEIEKKHTKFNKFFSNVSMLTVADSTPIDTQVALVNALKEVGN